MENMKISGRLWIQKDDRSLAGHGRIELLQRIAEAGSISQAAKNMGMSYKAAWDAINTMNNLAGAPLVERNTGGKGGGGTRLTARAQRLIASFHLIEEEHRRFLQALSENMDDFADTYQLLRRLNMKTSARNQFYGKVSEIKRGVINDEIAIRLPGGESIASTITRESTEHLGLQVGSDAVALIKAPWVIVRPLEGDIWLSARNQLAGVVVKLAQDAVNTEVVIQMHGGTTVCAVITNDNAQTLALKEGSLATAIFDAAHVIVGIPA